MIFIESPAVSITYNFAIVCGGAFAKTHKYSHTSLKTGLLFSSDQPMIA
jgi:hypothetical protein